jgi:hypothetical protein
MLKAKALAYDVDPAGDYMRPGNSPPEQAFQLLKCGLEMLLIAAEVYFPVRSRKYQKKGPKWLRTGVLYHGEGGALVLARAAPLLMVKADGFLEVDQPPELTTEHHRQLFGQVQSFYPLSKLLGNLLEDMEAEFKVMENHEPRDKVVSGEERGTEYSQALMRGENPDEDPELVAAQREFAIDYFIDTALHWGCRGALNTNDQKILKEKWMRLPELPDSAVAEHRARLREAWREGIKPYLEYARIEAESRE